MLDASAILALLNREPGAEYVEQYADETAASAVNVAEAGSRLSDGGMSDANIRQAIEALGMDVIPFDGDQAHESSALRATTRHKGLSLGDRACLALAKRLGLPALTADRIWADLDVGVEVRLIRE